MREPFPFSNEQQGGKRCRQKRRRKRGRGERERRRGGCRNRQGEIQQETLMGKLGEWEERKRRMRKDES